MTRSRHVSQSYSYEQDWQAAAQARDAVDRAHTARDQLIGPPAPQLPHWGCSGRCTERGGPRAADPVPM
jgi:hypothetical protein